MPCVEGKDLGGKSQNLKRIKKKKKKRLQKGHKKILGGKELKIRV